MPYSLRSESFAQYLPKREELKIESNTLYQRALNVVTQNFNILCSKASIVSPQLFCKILKELPVQVVDHCIASEFIHCEDFYRRASIDRFGNCKCIVECHGHSWKRLYYELILNELLTRMAPGDSSLELFKIVSYYYLILIRNAMTTDLTGITMQIYPSKTKAVQDYVFTLTLDLKGVDESLIPIFENLPNLTTFTLKNESTRVTKDDKNIKYHISHFGSTIQCASCLCSLTLSNCELDDDLVRVFLLSLEENQENGDIRKSLIRLDIVSKLNFITFCQISVR
jgi:hypothetical protein